MLSAIARVMRVRMSTSDGQHVRQAGLEQHVVEGERFARISVVVRGHRQLQLARNSGSMPAAGWLINRRFCEDLHPRPTSRPAFGLATVDSTGGRRFHRAYRQDSCYAQPLRIPSMRRAAFDAAVEPLSRPPHAQIACALTASSR